MNIVPSRSRGAARLVPPAVATLLLAWMLNAEFVRTTFEPTPLDFGAETASEAAPAADLALAPRPGVDRPGGTGDEGSADEIRVRVRGTDGAGAPWRGIGLRVRGAPGRRTSFTDENGEGRLPVPKEWAEAFGAGRLEVFLRDPGRADVVATPVRTSGEFAALADLEAPFGFIARLHIVDALGRGVPDRLQVVVNVEGERPSEPLSFAVAGGSAYVAGLPHGVPLRFIARPYGLPPAERPALLLADGGDIQDVFLATARPAADLEGQAGPADKRGDLVRLATWYGVRVGPPDYVGFGSCDDRGRFLVPVPPGANVVAEARSASGPAMSWFVPRLGRRDTAFLEWSPPETPRCRGRVTRPDGEPAASALVILAAAGAATRTSARPRPCATADEAGRFEVPTPAEGTWRAQARYLDPEGETVFTAEGPEEEPGRAAEVELELDPGGAVAGRLAGYPSEFFFGGGSLLGGPMIGVAVEDGAGTVLGFATPAVDGTFKIGAPAGLRRVKILTPGALPLVIDDVTVTAGGRSEDVRLEALAPARPFTVVVVRAERADAPKDGDARLVGAAVTARFLDPDAERRAPLVVETESLGLARLPVESGVDVRWIVTWEDPARGDFVLRPAEAAGPGPHVVSLRAGAVVALEGPPPPPPLPDVAVAFVLVREGPTDGAEPPASRALWIPWRGGTVPPQFGSVPNGRWRARLEIVREGPGGGATSLELGELRVRDADAAVALPIDAAAVARAILGN